MTGLFAMLAYLRAFLIARHRLAVEAVTLRQQLAVYKRKQPRPKLNNRIACSGSFFVGSESSGPKHSFSSSPKQWSVGIAPDSACSGHGDPADSEWGDRR